MKAPHEIEPVFTVEINDPSHFEALKAIHQATPVQTHQETPHGLVHTNLDKGLLFVDLESGGQWFMKFNPIDMDAMLYHIRNLYLEEVFYCGLDIKKAPVVLHERLLEEANTQDQLRKEVQGILRHTSITVTEQYIQNIN